MRKNKHFYTILCLVLGAVLLTTAAAANFGNANGYSAYKKSLLNMLEADNYSAELDVELTHNGQLLAKVESAYKVNAGGEVTSYSTERELNNMNSGAESNVSYDTQNWVVKNSDSSANRKFDYITYNRRNLGDWNIHNTNNSGIATQINNEISDKMIRFVEVLTDTLVGDLKNNFVMVSESNGEKSYQIVLRGNQLPEIVTAGFSLLYGSVQDSRNTNSFVEYDRSLSQEDVEKYSEEAWNFLRDKEYVGVVYLDANGEIIYFENSSDFYESEYFVTDVASANSLFYSMESEPVIDIAKMFLTLDSEGRLLSNTLEGTITGTGRDGSEQSITLKIDINLSDYGTTVIDMPAIPANETVHDYTGGTPENDYEYIITKDGVSKKYTDKALEKYEEAVEEPQEPIESIEP